MKNNLLLQWVVLQHIIILSFKEKELLGIVCFEFLEMILTVKNCLRHCCYWMLECFLPCKYSYKFSVKVVSLDNFHQQ